MITICRSLRQLPLPTHLLFVALGACRTESHPPAGANTASSRLPDSLVATGPRGLQVWFTLSRVGQAQNGISCVERGLEIRHGETRTPVPLLYTGAVPVLINDSTMRAELWNHCKPVSVYLVSLMSGQPVREGLGHAP